MKKKEQFMLKLLTMTTKMEMNAENNNLEACCSKSGKTQECRQWSPMTLALLDIFFSLALRCHLLELFFFHLTTLKYHYDLGGNLWLYSNSLCSPHKNLTRVQSHDNHSYAYDDQTSTTDQFLS